MKTTSALLFLTTVTVAVAQRPPRPPGPPGPPGPRMPTKCAFKCDTYEDNADKSVSLLVLIESMPFYSSLPSSVAYVISDHDFSRGFPEL